MRGYFAPDLLKNERIAYREHQHWVIFLPTLGWFFLAGVLYWHVPELPLLAYTAWFAMIISFGYAAISFYSSLFMVTNMRVIMRTGFFHRVSLEVFIERIESIEVIQSLVGGILRYGTVKVIGTGGTKDQFFKINDPLGFRRAVQEQLQNARAEK